MFRLAATVCFLVAAFASAKLDGREAQLRRQLTAILQNGVDLKVYPGAFAFVADLRGHVFNAAVGRFTYAAASPPVTSSTIFDLASLTKVLSTTTAVGVLLERGVIQDLDDKVATILGPSFANGGKEDITLRHLLTHTAGFQPDPSPWYWSTDFGCPATLASNVTGSAVPLVYSCLPKVYASLMSEQLLSPPGSKYL